MWCIGTVTGEYLANMEDVLDLYAQPAHADVVRICFDERPSQLLDQVLTPIPAKPGVSRKKYQEYQRKGVCNALLAYNTDTGQRHLKVTDTKTKADYADFMHWSANEVYPGQQLKVVQDNYGSHSYGAFYENLPVETARKLKNQVEFHFTPKHAFWLNIAEIEFFPPLQTMSKLTHRVEGNTRSRSPDLARKTKRKWDQSELVFYNRQGA